MYKMTVREIMEIEDIKEPITEDLIDTLLHKSYDGYLTRVEHAIRTTKLVHIYNYIMVFEVIKNDDGCNFVIKDLIIFYINKSGSKKIEYKNIKTRQYHSFDPNTINFSDIGFENWVKGGLFNKYGFVSMNNACYDITKPGDYECLYKEIDKILYKW
jgi:hypothetical protein